MKSRKGGNEMKMMKILGAVERGTIKKHSESDGIIEYVLETPKEWAPAL